MPKKKRKVKIVIDKEKCKGCLLCIGVCPQKNLIVSKEVNAKGYQYVKLEDPDICTGCGLCYIMCPDCSIEIEKEEEKEKKS